jgi:hypothetical protein
MAVQTVTANVNADAIASGAWRSNDGLTINDGAVVTVNTNQDKFWNSITINNGKLRIENTSTTDAIRFIMGRVTGTSAATITPSSGLGSIEIAGNWIEVGTSNGTAGQTFTVPYRDYVAALWVETAPSSGVYESWANAGEPYGMVPKWLLSGLAAFGKGRKGMVFKQTPNTAQHRNIVLTNCSCLVGSRIIEVSDTTDISPGAHVTGTTLAANSVVERVLSATQFEVNANAIGTSLGIVTLTIYTTWEVQHTNQVVFGDDFDGAIPPNGCKIRIPNIMVTHVCGENIHNGAGSGTYITLTNSGSLTADTCLFDVAPGNYTGAEKLSLKRIGCSYPPTLSKVYGIDIDDMCVAVRPFRNHWGATTPVLDTTATNAGSNGTLWAISYITGSVKKIHIAATKQIGGGTSSILRFDYCDGLTLEDTRLICQGGRNAQSMLALYYVNNSIIDGVETYGGPPIRFVTSSDNKVSNVVFGMSVYSEGVSYDYTRYTLSAQYDPVTGNPLAENTRYYIKPFWQEYANRGYTGFYGNWREHSAVPHLMPTDGVPQVWVTPGNNTVSVSWTRLDPTHTSPAYEVYRSTDPAVPVRDAGTRVFTTNTVTIVTAADATAVNGTTYYYVLRKYSSAGVYVDTPALRATPSAANGYTNFARYSHEISSSTWVKSNITAGSTAAWPASGMDGNTGTSIRQLLATADNGTATLSVTGLTIATTYTASILMRAVPRKATNTLYPTVAGRITFGTAFTDFTLTDTLEVKYVTFVATATSHDLVIRMNRSADVIAYEGVFVTATSVPVFTQGTGASAVTPDIGMSYAGSRGYTGGGETRNQGIILNGSSNLVWNVWCIGTDPDFVPSKENILYWNSAATPFFVFTTSSNRNVLENVTQSGWGGAIQMAFNLTASSSDNYIRNIDLKLGTGYLSGTFANIDIQLDSNRNRFKNIQIDGNMAREASNPVVYTLNTANDTILENVRTEFGSAALYTYNNGMIFKGVGGGGASKADGAATTPLWNIGSTIDGLTQSGLGVFDTHFTEMYHTPTTGALGLVFTASTQAVKPYELTGLATFSNTGRLYLQQAGDSVTYTWPHKIYGVSGFRSILPKVLTADLEYSSNYVDVPQALLIEVQIDTGSGYGSWIEATPANMAALSVSATTGFNIKIKLTARQFFRYSSRTNNFVVGETVRHVAGGGTARIVADFPSGGVAGVCVIDEVVGNWTTNSAIVRDSDSQARANIVYVNTSFALGPSFNSYIQGLYLWTTVDQTATYPDDMTTVTFTGLPSGCDIVILTAGTNTIIDQVDQNVGTSYAYAYAGTPTIDVGFIKPGYQVQFIRNLTLGLTSSTIPVSLIQDRNYI